jgi:hypothetical protein
MKSQFASIFLITVFLLSAQSVAMKSRREALSRSCDEVWRAAIAVAKTQQYRIVSASKEEWIVSVAVGGAWAGERIISLSLASDGEQRCIATVQSRFSGLAHSDGPDLLERVHVELVGEILGRDSEAFRKYKHCIRDLPPAECDVKLLPGIAASTEGSQPGTPPENAHP